MLLSTIEYATCHRKKGNISFSVWQHWFHIWTSVKQRSHELFNQPMLVSYYFSIFAEVRDVTVSHDYFACWYGCTDVISSSNHRPDANSDILSLEWSTEVFIVLFGQNCLFSFSSPIPLFSRFTSNFFFAFRWRKMKPPRPGRYLTLNV